MQFSNAREIEQVVWQMRLADYPRGVRRALIDNLANGAPPIPPDQAESNGVEVNVNDLTLTRLAHDARLQLYQGFNKPGNFFTLRTDGGAAERRSERGSVVTTNLNRYLKRSDQYYQAMLSKIALLVMHGVGPSMWETEDRWCGTPLEMADVMIPSRTRLTFDNLPFFAVWRSYTPYMLRRLTRHPERNPGWRMKTVERAIEWAIRESAKLYGGTQWSEYWVPEKAVARSHEDAGMFASDIVQTIDCWDFYYWDDEGGHEGWRRRIIFDAEGGQGAWRDNPETGYEVASRDLDKNLIGDTGLFLYSSGNRVVADHLDEILHFQFADLSARAPFTYHEVRSLGFLMYAVCHLQNRYHCALSEAAFENLLNYMRVSSQSDVERALKVQLVNRGIIDESVHFLSPAERWQPNPQMIELGLNQFQRIISENSSSYLQNQNLSRDRVEKTKFQVMAEVNAMQTLVSAGLRMAYRYQTSEYREIVRRFMRKDSSNQDVREFRARCLKQGVPDNLLVPGAWDVEPETTVGGGNKTLEMAIAQQLMEWRPQFPPESQAEILRLSTLATTDDAALANRLVPFEPGVSNSKHDAMVAFGSLMAGAVVQFRKDHSELEIAQTLLAELAMAVQKAKAGGGMVSPDKLAGLQNVVRTVSELVGSISQDKTQKEVATKLANVSGKLANEVKGFAQRLAQQMKAQQGAAGDGGEMAKTRAKMAAALITAQAKAKTTRESHAARTAQREAQHELETQQRQREHAMDIQERQREHALDLSEKAQSHALDLAAKKASAEIEIRRSRLKSTAPKGE